MPTDSIQKHASNAAQAKTDNPPMALHGAPDRNVGKEAGRIELKEVLAYNEMLADIKHVGEDEAALCGVMMS